MKFEIAYKMCIACLNCIRVGGAQSSQRWSWRFIDFYCCCIAAFTPYTQCTHCTMDAISLTLLNACILFRSNRYFWKFYIYFV